MGTSRSGFDWARKLTGFAATMDTASEKGAIAAAEVVRVAVLLAAGRYATSPLLRMSVTPVPPTGALVRMTSPKAHLLDRDTRAISRTGGDTILPGAVTGVRGRKEVLGSIQRGFGPVASSRKGATQGKRMWEKGVAAGLPKAELAISNSLSVAALAAFSL